MKLSWFARFKIPNWEWHQILSFVVWPFYFFFFFLKVFVILTVGAEPQEPFGNLGRHHKDSKCSIKAATTSTYFFLHPINQTYFDSRAKHTHILIMHSTTSTVVAAPSKAPSTTDTTKSCVDQSKSQATCCHCGWLDGHSPNCPFF